MNCDKVSVIIAVFNAAAYLQRSVESVLNQSYKNIEVFLIDDGSTDGSGALCDSIAADDNRVIVIHKKNEGLSVARNIALERATGQYVSFIDSDDELREDAYERSIDVLRQTGADVIKYDYCVEKIDLYKKNDCEPEIESTSCVVNKILHDEYGSQLWQYLFRVDLWEGIESPAGRLAQDMMTLHLAVARASKVAILHENLYYYFQTRTDNVSNGNRKNIRGTADRAYAYWLRFSFCQENNDEYLSKDFCLKKAVDYSVSCFCRNEFLQEERYKADYYRFEEHIRNNKTEIMRNTSISFLRKICVCVILSNPRYVSTVFNLVKKEGRK